GRQAGRRAHYPPLPLLEDEEVIQEQPDQTALTERYTERCVRFIRHNRDRPFFLYMAHMHVHLPYYAAPRFMKNSRNGPYGACVEAIDWSTGVLLWELKRLGLDDKTLVLFTSDNGSRGDRGGSNGPLNGRKGTTWEGGQRVPLIARFPGVVPAGSVCSEMALAMDFLPTLAALAGASPPSDRIIDGKNIWPLFCGEEGARSPHDAFFYYRCDALQAVRSGKWKLHVWRDQGPVQELYDLSEDIGETRNLYSQHPDVVRRLMEKVEACREDLGDAALGRVGKNIRPIGRVENPAPLTQYNPDHPYIEAEYDLSEAG
ncbi:MAG: sulfatase-like hydrolase/transferase, partial [Armatimonadota bacterium]|nr:sulfatase-like hydrolase/transferase [Armatimonadota bacterium]